MPRITAWQVLVEVNRPFILTVKAAISPIFFGFCWLFLFVGTGLPGWSGIAFMGWVRLPPLYPDKQGVDIALPLPV
jgi:hypothetical protein